MSAEGAPADGADARPPERHDVPAWLRETDVEGRLTASIAIAVAVAIQLWLPNSLVFEPRWVLPTLGTVLFVALLIVDPARQNGESAVVRAGSLVLAGAIGVANVWSVVRLVLLLFRGGLADRPGLLFGSVAAVWLTNVIAFALWYWELDRGGPVARANARRAYPDFQFVQMTDPKLGPPDWEPTFVDYLYLSFTNVTAFSPTDVMPLTRWAKLAMMLQAGISLVLTGLVIARAVNVVGGAGPH